MVRFSILWVALEYWQSDLPNNAIYNISSRQWKFYFSISKGSVSSIMVSAESLKPLETDWQFKSLIFSSHQNLDGLKIPKNAITFDLLRYWKKKSLFATTAFISPIKVAIGRLQLLRSKNCTNYPFRSSCDWLSIVQICQEVLFNMDSSRFSNLGFPISTNLLSSFGVSI